MQRSFRRLASWVPAAAALLFAGLVAATPAGAQDAAPSADPVVAADALSEALATPDAVRALVAELPDEAVRRLLLERLVAVAVERAAAEQAAPPGLSPLAIAERAVAGAFFVLADAVLRLPTLVSQTVGAVFRFGSERGLTGVFAVFGWLAVAVAAGLAAEAALERIARPWRASIERLAVSATTLRQRVVTLMRRLVLDIGRLVVFYIVARMVAVTMIPPADAPLVSGIATWAILMPRVVAAISRFILAPKAPALRLVAADDAGAAGLHRDQVSIAVFVGVIVAVIVFSESMGVATADTRLGLWGTLVALVWLGVAVHRRADTLESMMRGFDEVTEAEARVARAYPRMAIAATAITFLGFCALVGNGFGALVAQAQHMTTLAVVLMAPAFDTLVRALVRNLAPPMTGEGAMAATAHAAMLRSWIRIGRVIALGLVLAAISQIWGLGLERLLAGDAPAPIAALARFVSVLLFGYVALEVARLWFNTRLMRERTPDGAVAPMDDAAEGGGAGGSRLSTVLPLLSLFVQSAIVVMTVLVALSNLGVNVTPLLAGAGVLGLAIGFGAQKLVADVVSGVFFLIDDAFRVGEFVDVGGTTGKVEQISVRSMRLRGHLGPVHTIPYGDVRQITNFSRDWVIMKLKFTVPFDTDLEKVRKIFKKIGQDMLKNPEMAGDFIEPFKSQGVLEVNDVGIVLRGKFMARPGRQFMLRKEIYSRVQKAFDEAGIQFARKEVRVRVDGAEDMPEAEKRAVAAAAQEAAETAAR